MERYLHYDLDVEEWHILVYELGVNDRQSTAQYLEPLHELGVLSYELAGERCGICGIMLSKPQPSEYI